MDEWDVDQCVRGNTKRDDDVKNSSHDLVRYQSYLNKRKSSLTVLKHHLGNKIRKENILLEVVKRQKA